MPSAMVGPLCGPERELCARCRTAERARRAERAKEILREPVKGSAGITGAEPLTGSLYDSEQKCSLRRSTCSLSDHIANQTHPKYCGQKSCPIAGPFNSLDSPKHTGTKQGLCRGYQGQRPCLSGQDGWKI